MHRHPSLAVMTVRIEVLAKTIGTTPSAYRRGLRVACFDGAPRAARPAGAERQAFAWPGRQGAASPDGSSATLGAASTAGGSAASGAASS